MNLYDITVSVRIRCQAMQVGDAEDVVYHGVDEVLHEWVERLQELPEDADKPLVLEEVAELPPSASSQDTRGPCELACPCGMLPTSCWCTGRSSARLGSPTVR